MYRKIKTTAAIGVLLMTVMLSATILVSAAGPNYMGFAPTPKDVTVGDSFRFDVYGDIHREIDTIAVDNMTFLPAGVVNYTSTARGALFMPANDYTVMWHAPTGAGIKNALGWAKYWLWNFDVPGYGSRINNTNATAFNITWLAVKCGTATTTITAGGTAGGGIDPGTTKRTGTIRVHPKSTTAFTATSAHYNQIDLSWTKQTGDDKVLIRYKTGSNPTSITDGTLLYNDTGISTSHSGLSSGDHMYYSIWGWNNTAGFYSLTYQTADKQTNRISVFSSENPTDNSGNINKNHAAVSVAINEPDGHTFNWTIHGTNVTTASANGASNGTKTASLITPLSYGTNIIWYVNATDGADWTNATYNFTVRNEYAPVPPTDFTATAITRFRIDLSWSPSDDLTYIEWYTSPTWARGGGNFCYVGTGSYAQDVGIVPGDHIYYQAWSYNATDAVYSSSYATADNTSIDDLAPIVSSPDPTNNTIIDDKNYPQVSAYINDPEGDAMAWTIEVSNGDSSSDTVIVNGTIFCTLSIPLDYSTTYTWWVNVTDVFKTTREIYTFTVRDAYEPTVPTGFIATPVSCTEIDLNWTVGTGNDKVVIVAKLGSAPTGISDGTIIYNNSGTTYPDTGLGPNQHWYYIAYSWNTTDELYSSTYASADATTTANSAPDSFTNEHPTNNSPYCSVYNEYLNVTVSDPDSDSMNVYFYWGNNTPIAFTTIDSGEKASIYLPSYISPDWLQHQNIKTNYTWYAVANDSYAQTKSSTWDFKTSYAWDINEDGSVTYEDASALVTAYGITVTAGSTGPDIDNNGDVNYLDASSFVAHYGDVY
jgi:hypothetical protein